MNTAELSRLLANLIKQGTIAESDPAAGRVRVQHGGLTTDWLPYFVPAAGGVSVHRPPSVGENCIVLTIDSRRSNQSAVHYWLHEQIYNTPDVTVNFVAIGRWK